MGTHTAERLQNSRVLMVGAGGIGCELLKNLALSGFGHIEAVDLDTIDLSNLNRQFLFQTQHIKQSKAKVARESALRFNPSARITAHHASIFEDRFDLAWFRSFDLVLNALDNVAARRHVNLMCIAANVPLVESGTAGYHGQVSLHLRNHSACYDCSPKPIERKTYPVCTIRSTPSEPIHCIVWAKNYLYSSLFGNAEDDSDAMTTDATSDNAQELQELKAESAALQQLRDNLGKDQYGQLVFEKVFDKDIRRLLAMDDLWKKTRKPDTLSYAQLQSAMSDFVPSDPSALSFDQSVWDLHHNVHVFLASMNELAKTLLEERKADANYQLSFDKDDEPSLNFVTAAANLRAACFHIGQKSRFEVKQMAGNIIPAIATTNAIVAGMMVMLAFKTLLGQSSACKNTFIQYGGIRNHFLSSESLPAPNPSCSVCSVAYFALRINTANSKLSDVIDRVILGGEFGTGDKTDGLGLKGEITVQRDQALIYDVEFDDNRDSLLSQLSVKDRSRLTITNDVDHDDPDQSAAVPVAVTLFIEHWYGMLALLALSDGSCSPFLLSSTPEQARRQGRRV
ncbi:hypothetical protein BC831DRAFT_396439 [Entophlyctis helioformis]|nr:hypothetical protein BC831DRAFT_396439 [Entophlyctis helioformis]